MKKIRPQNRHLKKWKKGQSGNAKGAPTYGETFEMLYKRHLNKDVSKYIDENPIKEGVSLKEAIVINDLIKALAGSNTAIERVMDRTEGKAIQRIINEDGTLDRIKRESGGDPAKAKAMLRKEFEERGLFDTQITFAEDVEGLDYNDSDDENSDKEPTTTNDETS